ncbi:MAG: response regulator [Planctomycetota bacterium]
MTCILILDDEPTFLHVLSVHLERRGYQVRIAKSIQEAIRLAEECPPGLLLVDWMLGESMNGVDVCATLRQMNSEVRTVLMTGHIDPPEVSDGKHRCVDRRLDKPFFLENLDAVLRELNLKPAGEIEAT